MRVNNTLQKSTTILTVILLSFWFIITAWLFYSYITSPYLNEYREFSNADCALSFINGTNPFTIEGNPQSIYLYGPLFPWISSILYHIFPFLNILIFMRIISTLFTISTCLIVWKELEEESLITKVIAVCIASISGWSVVSLSAFPNSMGTFCFILALYIIRRKTNWKGLIYCSLIVAATFFIKQYYIAALAPICIYLFIKSQKLLYKFFLIFTVIFTILTIFCYYMFPLYFEYTFTHHIHMRGTKSFAHLWKQIEVISVVYFPLFIILIYKLYTNIKKNKFNLNSLQNNRFLIYYITLVIMLVVLIRLGEHHGAYLTYFYQLIIVPIVICSFHHFNRIAQPTKKYLNLVVTAIVLIVPLCNSLKSANEIRSNLNIWNATYKDLRINKSSNILLLTPVLNHYAYNHDIAITNTGQTEYLPTLISSKFQGANKKYIQGNKYFDSIKTCISEKKYDVIYTDVNSFIKSKEIEKTYLLTDSINLNLDVYCNSNSIFNQFIIYKWIRR